MKTVHNKRDCIRGMFPITTVVIYHVYSNEDHVDRGRHRPVTICLLNVFSARFRTKFAGQSVLLVSLSIQRTHTTPGDERKKNG